MSTDADFIAFKKAALKQKQSLPLEGKVILAQERIREWYEYCEGQVYVSFSGGKDSTVLLHLVRSIYPEVPGVFVDTGLEYPEIREFVKTIPNVIIVRPSMNFKQVIETYGYPVVSKDVARKINYARKGSSWATNCILGVNNDGSPSSWKSTHYKPWAFLKDAPFKISEHCCNVMKKRPIKKWQKENGGYPYIGTMACESALRRSNWLKTGCNAYEGENKHSMPLSFWMEEDVLAYIRENNLPIAKVYGEIVEDENGHLKTTGVQRTGCMFCMFGAHLEKSPNRFQRMKKTHPKQYEYCMKSTDEGGLGLGEVLDYIGVPKE